MLGERLCQIKNLYRVGPPTRDFFTIKASN